MEWLQEGFELPLEPEDEGMPEPGAKSPAAGGLGDVVLISGGDRGIGAAAARAFCAAGYHVAALYRADRAAAQALAEELGRAALVMQCDVTNRAACAEAVAAVQAAFGRIDVLVCNAGIAQQKLFTDITPEEWQHMLDVNLTGAFHLCQLVLPGMIRRKYGRILTVSSMWGQTGGSCEAAYSAAKGAVLGLTKALAKEVGPSGITVNAVAPGVIGTDMMSFADAATRAALREETPLGRLGTPEDVAEAIYFLCQDAAGFITGQVIGVNGGMVI